jgi:hypothetical protein
MGARVRLLRPLPRFGWYNAPVEVDMTREQWLAASRLLGSDAVLLEYRAPPEVEAVIASILEAGGPSDAAPVDVPPSTPRTIPQRKRGR